MKKLIMVLLIGMISSTLFGQIESFPMGGKWIYGVFDYCYNENNGTAGNDTILIEKDTLVKGFNLRKLIYTKNSYMAKYLKYQPSFLFLTSATGIYLYDKDTLRLQFPLDIKVGDTTTIELLNVDKLTKKYKFSKSKLICDSVNTVVKLGKILVKEYTVYTIGNSAIPKKPLRSDFCCSDSYPFKYNSMFGFETLRNALVYANYYYEFTNCGLQGYFSKFQWGNLVYDFYNYSESKSTGGWSLLTSVQEENNTEFLEIYPNPVKEEFNIKGDFSENDWQYEITNIVGKTVKKDKLSSYTISVNEIENGIYFIKLYNTNKIFIKKIIIQK